MKTIQDYERELIVTQQERDDFKFKFEQEQKTSNDVADILTATQLALKEAGKALKQTGTVLHNTRTFYVCSNCGTPDGCRHTVNCVINKSLANPLTIAAMKGK